MKTLCVLLLSAVVSSAVSLTSCDMPLDMANRIAPNASDGGPVGEVTAITFICPNCGNRFPVKNATELRVCPKCRHSYNPILIDD